MSSSRKGKSKRSKSHSGCEMMQLFIGCMIGCLICTTFIMISTYEKFTRNKDATHPYVHRESSSGNSPNHHDDPNRNDVNSVLHGKSILVAIASFDFSQKPHVEEVLDGFRDLCETGAKVDVVVHSTVPYPVAMIDLLNTRMRCTNPDNLSITISLQSPRLRLHLVDLHRPLFYENLDKYDLFVYTEDDIRIRPTTVAAYLQETERVIDLIGKEQSSIFNVGVVRYEYNFPPSLVIDDKSRHVTQNVTRVYWEHSGEPIENNVVNPVKRSELNPYYVSMGNHHQGMFLATPDLLKAWKDKKGCDFDVVRDRPGMKKKPSQPSEGTQRVWMSSHMLYGGRHCNVQQLLPMDNFGALTVLHLPNKNYRRVGKQGRLGGNKKGAPKNEFGDGTERYEGPDSSLITAMQLHVAIQQNFQPKQKGAQDYKGIKMVNDIDPRVGAPPPHVQMVNKAMDQYEAYVARGGVLSKSDIEEAINGPLQF